MSEQIEQARLGNYGITVFFDTDITFFSIVEDSNPNRTPLLIWKKDVGFETSVVVCDPKSDLEFTKPLDASEFPSRELQNILRDHPDPLSARIATCLVSILEQL